ncbi:MAG: tetratricopeptide repeat protein [bacterium]|nr:tetratricopeptide repeat protein [bacterium]
MVSRSIFLGLLFVALAAAPVFAQGQLDGSETLFAVLAAIHAAGFDTDLDSPSNHPLRRQLAQHLASRQIGSVEKLKEFYEERRLDTPTATFGQYVSYALHNQGPPDFKFKLLTYQLPPDVQRLEGFERLLTLFYKEADVASLWRQAQPAFEEAIGKYHQPTAQAVYELNGYLRNPTSGISGRRFSIVVSLLGPPNQVHTRSYDTDYYLVVTPSAEPRIQDIRYTYLHYLLDRAATRFQNKLYEKKALGDYALGAPHLSDHYKIDFLLLATTSLIRAIEARLARVPAEEKQALVDQAWRRGFILTPHFAEQLPTYERQPQAMQFYFGEMVDAIDLAAEEARVQDLEFEQAAPVRKAKTAPVSEPVVSEAEKRIEEAEALLRQQELDKAREMFLTLIRQTPVKPLQARAYFGLGKIATLRNEPELSVTLFKKTLELSPEPQEKAWSLVYLGRLSDLSGESQRALEYYRAALEVEGGSALARETAEQGASEAFRRQRPAEEP